MENNYVVIELELTAIQWAVDNCRMYLAGTEFTAIHSIHLHLQYISTTTLEMYASSASGVRLQDVDSSLLLSQYVENFVNKITRMINKTYAG